MSDMLVTLRVVDAAVDPLGIKEAIAMDIEKYGGLVQVVQVKCQDPEQIEIYGRDSCDRSRVRRREGRA